MVEVKVVEVEDKGKSFLARVFIEGEVFSRMFPKGEGWMSEDADGAPAFVRDMVGDYRKTLQTQDVKKYEGESFDAEKKFPNPNNH